DVALLGSPSDSRAGKGAGVGYILRRGADDVWRQEQYVVAPDPQQGARFGASIAISGNAILIGASGDSTVGPDAGAAYIFRFNGYLWNFEQKFVPDSPGEFGYSVALDGDLAVVGAWLEDHYTGRVYIYRFDGASWVREARLASDDSDTEKFGADVATSR